MTDFDRVELMHSINFKLRRFFYRLLNGGDFPQRTSSTVILQRIF